MPSAEPDVELLLKGTVEEDAVSVMVKQGCSPFVCAKDEGDVLLCFSVVHDW